MCSVYCTISQSEKSGVNKDVLPARYTDKDALKDGLLNNRVFTVKFLEVQSYFLCNTTHTDKAINQKGPGGLVIQIL